MLQSIKTRRKNTEEQLRTASPIDKSGKKEGGNIWENVKTIQTCELLDPLRFHSIFASCNGEISNIVFH